MEKKKFKQIISIALGVCTILGAIVAIPVIYDWFITPQVKVCIDGHELSEEQKVVLHYLLPSTGKERKNVLLFPITINNEDDKNVPNFLLEMHAQPKDVIINGEHSGYMPRLLDYNVYFSNKDGSIPLRLHNDKPNQFSTLQILSNKGNRQNFAAGSEISNFVVLNSINDKLDDNNNPWDAFNINLKICYGKNTVNIYDIDVVCYYSDNDDLTIQLLRQKLNQDGSINFAIRTMYKQTIVQTPDSSKLGVWTLTKNGNAVIPL